MLGLCVGLAGLKGGFLKLACPVIEVYKFTVSGVLLLLAPRALQLVVLSEMQAQANSTASFLTSLPGSQGATAGAGADFRGGALQADLAMLSISRKLSIVLLVLLLVYIVFLFFYRVEFNELIKNAEINSGGHGPQTEEQETERNDNRRKSAYLTLTETLLCYVLLLVLMWWAAASSVDRIADVVEAKGWSDSLLGVVMVPSIQKIPEGLLILIEAWEGHLNLAILHFLHATIQFISCAGPVLIIGAWIKGIPLALDFSSLHITILLTCVFSLQFLFCSQRVTSLSGVCCIVCYVLLVFFALKFPNPQSHGGDHGPAGGGHSTGEHSSNGKEHGIGSGISGGLGESTSTAYSSGFNHLGHGI